MRRRRRRLRAERDSLVEEVAMLRKRLDRALEREGLAYAEASKLQRENRLLRAVAREMPR